LNFAFKFTLRRYTLVAQPVMDIASVNDNGQLPGYLLGRACRIMFATSSTRSFVPLFLSQIASYDVASNICQTLLLGRVVGEGGFCKVRAGIHQVTGAKTAVKLIDKARLIEPNDRRRVVGRCRLTLSTHIETALNQSLKTEL
jgi:hypothetical protein